MDWMQLIIILLPIILEWLSNQKTKEQAQLEIAVILAKSKPGYGSETYLAAAIDITERFQPKPGGVLEEIAKIGAIIDAIIEILKKIFGKN